MVNEYVSAVGGVAILFVGSAAILAGAAWCLSWLYAWYFERTQG